MTIDFPNGLGQIIYEMDYFAGSQVLVYANHILIDDCVRIGWSVQQNRQPIWGYASQYFNALASGVVMVNGSLWIAFKEAAYMPVLLGEAYRVMNGTEVEDGAVSAQELTHSRRRTSTPSGSSGLGTVSDWANSVVEEANRSTPSREEVETLVTATEEDSNSLEVARSLAQVVTALGTADDEEFEDVAERFEDIVWGPESIALGNESTVSRDGVLPRRVDQYPPVDLVITFGDMHTAAANHSSFRLCDVSFVSSEVSAIEPTGEPILVRYDFIARSQM